MSSEVLEMGSVDTVLGDVRLRVTSADPGKPVFVGVAPADAVFSYLGGVGSARLTGFPADRATYTVQPGGAPAVLPMQSDICVAKATGSGTQTLVWPGY